VTYGPYSTRPEYDDGLKRAFQNSRPNGLLDNHDMTVFQKVAALLDETKIFHARGLTSSKYNCRWQQQITGIVDWATSGFIIKEREYFETRSRVGNGNWAAAVDAIFECDTTNEIHTLLNEFDRELVVYTGI
jgi:hypothetical protein